MCDTRPWTRDPLRTAIQVHERSRWKGHPEVCHVLLDDLRRPASIAAVPTPTRHSTGPDAVQLGHQSSSATVRGPGHKLGRPGGRPGDRRLGCRNPHRRGHRTRYGCRPARAGDAPTVVAAPAYLAHHGEPATARHLRATTVSDGAGRDARNQNRGSSGTTGDGSPFRSRVP